MSLGAYVSGGLNPNTYKTCGTCLHRNTDGQYRGFGWCSLRNNASVSSTGGCSEHSDLMPKAEGIAAAMPTDYVVTALVGGKGQSTSIKAHGKKEAVKSVLCKLVDECEPDKPGIVLSVIITKVTEK